VNPSLKDTESAEEATLDREDEDFEEKSNVISKGRRRKRAEEEDDEGKTRQKKIKPTPKPKDPKLTPKCGLLILSFVHDLSASLRHRLVLLSSSQSNGTPV
jgi:hypothetical protein